MLWVVFEVCDHTPYAVRNEKRWLQHPLQDGMAKARANFFTHRALEPKVWIMERWSTDPLDGSTTCLYVSVHAVDSQSYIFDVKLRQYLITCNTLTDQGIGGVSKWLKLVTHTLHLVIHLIGTIGIFAWVYSSPPSQALLAIRRLDRLIWAFQENLKVVWLTLVREHLTTCMAPRLLRMDLHSVQLS